MNISVPNKYARAVRALAAAVIGGAASMDVLCVFHNWAYNTEFKSWVTMTLIHSFLVFVFLALWFSNVPPGIPNRSVVAKGAGATLLGGLLSVLVSPPYGRIILIISGQAFITSSVATLMYICLAYQRHSGASPTVRRSPDDFA